MINQNSTFHYNFVTRQGDQFNYNGEKFRFIGVNYYPFMVENTSLATIQAIMDACYNKGIKVIRTWCFDVGKPPSDSVGNFRFLDYPLGTSLISNTDFETNTTGWTLEAGLSRSNLDAYTGSYSIKHLVASGFNGMYSDPINVSANTNYTFTMWYKIVSRSGFGPLLHITKTDLITDIYDGGLLEDATGQWVRKQITFNTGSNTQIVIRVQNFSGNVSAYFDNFNLSLSGTPFLNTRESTFVKLDQVLDEARKREIKLILSLADNNTNYNTKQTYVDWANSIYGTSLTSSFPYAAFFTSQYCQQLYKDFINILTSRVNTINGRVYRDDSTIFSWELGNELRIDRDDPSGINTLNSQNLYALAYPHVDTQPGANQFPNPSFETDTSGWTLQGDFTRSNEVAHDGTYSIKQVSTSDYSKFYARLTLAAFTDYTWTFWTKVSNPSGFAPVMFVGTTLGGNEIVDAGFNGDTSGQWVKRTIAFNTGAHTDIYLMISNFSGVVTAYYDDFSLTSSANYNGWVDIMSKHIKTMDPNHMVGFGDMGHTWQWADGDTVSNGTYYGVDYDLMTQLTCIDYLDFHMYPTQSDAVHLQNYGQRLGYPNLASGDGFRSQLYDYVKIGHKNGKPVLIGEIGFVREITADNSKYPLNPRYIAFKNIFKDFFESGGDGILLWHGSSGEGGTYTINLNASGGEDRLTNTDDTNLVNLISRYNTDFDIQKPYQRLFPYVEKQKAARPKSRKPFILDVFKDKEE